LDQRTNHKHSNFSFPEAFSFYIQVGEGVDLIIHHPDQVLESMNEWCVKQHGDSGLTEAVKNSQVFSIRQFLLKISFGFLSLVSYNNIGIVVWKQCCHIGRYIADWATFVCHLLQKS
jgi:oligoribonuclease